MMPPITNWIKTGQGPPLPGIPPEGGEDQLYIDEISNILYLWNASALQWGKLNSPPDSILMTDGVTAPPVPLYTEDGTDYLYVG